MTIEQKLYSWDVYVTPPSDPACMLRIGLVSACASEATARLEALYWFSVPGPRPTCDITDKLVYEDDTLIVRQVQ